MILPQLPLIGYAALETIRTSYVIGPEFRNNHVSSRVAMRNFVKYFWKIEDCGVNCFVGLDSTRYIMNGTYELCFCWSFRPKTMLVISEHSILWKMLHNMAVYNVLKYLWCNAGKWHGPIIWRIRFLSFLVDSAHVGVFPLDRHSSGINTILIYISKNLLIFPGHFPFNQEGIPSGPYALSAFNPLSCFSTPLVVMFIDPIVGIGLSPGCGIFSVSSLLKTLENWLFSSSALALSSVNTPFNFPL